MFWQGSLHNIIANTAADFKSAGCFVGRRAVSAFTPNVGGLVRLALVCLSVSTRKLITDQIFVKGAGVTGFPFDWKGELSALNVEACSGKWVDYLFQTVDLSWVKWRSFMSEGCKGQKREAKRRSVALKSRSHLRNWNSIPDLSGMAAGEWFKMQLVFKFTGIEGNCCKKWLHNVQFVHKNLYSLLPTTCTWTHFQTD